MQGFCYRYSWIAPETLQSFFPRSDFITRLKELNSKRRRLLLEPPQADTVNASLKYILKWIGLPLWRNRLTRKSIKKALQAADGGYNEQLAWAELICEYAQESERSQSPPYDEMLVFLQQLCHSDFPQLLLWSQRRFANRIFQVQQRGVCLNTQYLEKKRKLAQAAHSCIRYALGAVGRMAPRQAWVGVGHGRFRPTGETYITIGKDKELIRVEPDIAWINRNWKDLRPRPLMAGETAWTYLESRINEESNDFIRNKYRDILHRAGQCIATLNHRIREFSAIEEFLRYTEQDFRASVSEQTWKNDPHLWWVTRIIPEPAELSDQLMGILENAYHDFHHNRLRQGLINDDPAPPPHRPAIPYPLRVQLSRNQQVIAAAEEFIHWVVKSDSVTPRPWMPDKILERFGYVYWQDHKGIMFQFVEPNPRRPVERFLAQLPSLPPYVNQHHYPPGIAPPSQLVDNRLVRLAGPEIPAGHCRAGDDIMFYSTLLNEQTQGLFYLELQSPIYRRAPDLVPIMVPENGDQSTSFGTLVSAQNIWFIRPAQTPVMLNQVRNAKQLAMWYYWEIHEALGSPDCLSLIVEGKPTQLPTHSLLAFDHLLHLLRTIQTPLILSHPRRLPAASFFRDAQGKALATQVVATLQEF